MLLLEHRTRELFARSVAAVRTGQGAAPLHALEVTNRSRQYLQAVLTSSCQTLSVFLSCLLSKRYPHPSSDIMVVLAGLDHIDAVFTEFVSALEGIIRNGKGREEPWNPLE